MTIPFDVVIWDAKECAEYLKIERSTFLKRVQYTPGFPKRCPIPGQPRWSAKKVAEWAIGNQSQEAA